MLKLNIGCGKDIREGFVNLDVKKDFAKFMSEEDIFLVADVKSGLPFKEKIFDVIIVQDLLEHFDKYFVHIIFADIVRILKLRGVIY